MVDAESSEWILLAYRWALEQFGTDVFYDYTVLVTPTPAHFPDRPRDCQDFAGLIFESVKEYAGMQNWPCKLVCQDPDVCPAIDPLIPLENPPTQPAGTFSISEAGEAEAVISYNPGQLSRPQSLIATLAHELAHYLGETAQWPPPGGEKNWEYATDLLAVFLGFGVFLANSAVEFQQFTGYNSQGWSARRLGYLSEFELVYCLAVFCTLKKITKEDACSHLKESLVPVYSDCLSDLEEKSEIVSQLTQVRSTARTSQ